MDVVLKQEIRTARKFYNCDAYAWFNRCNMSKNDCTPDQVLVVEALEANKGKIFPGQSYRYVRGVFENRMVTWRAHLGMDGVNKALKLYEDY